MVEATEPDPTLPVKTPRRVRRRSSADGIELDWRLVAAYSSPGAGGG